MAYAHSIQMDLICLGSPSNVVILQRPAITAVSDSRFMDKNVDWLQASSLHFVFVSRQRAGDFCNSLNHWLMVAMR